MKLKMIGFCVFATCTCILLNAAEQVPIEPSVGEITYGYELTLALDKTTYSVGEPVIAKVVLKNVSDRDRTLNSARDASTEIWFIITHEREPAKTEPHGGSVFSANAIGAMFPHSLKAG